MSKKSEPVQIEVVYEEILRKPGVLSEEERRIIESHVTRGVEILTSLSSFQTAIIDGVRHHHESIDGSGYPAGLAGEQIPLYARIIKICDAIDAMLSDRPYRSALTPEEVREQLDIFRGIQFDETIVQVVIGSGLIELHLPDMGVGRETDLSLGSDSMAVLQAGLHGTVEASPLAVSAHSAGQLLGEEGSARSASAESPPAPATS